VNQASILRKLKTGPCRAVDLMKPPDSLIAQFALGMLLARLATEGRVFIHKHPKVGYQVYSLSKKRPAAGFVWIGFDSQESEDVPA